MIEAYRRARDDSGVATVAVCFLAMALIAFTLLGLQVGAATVARERAETAADLGALAGAAAVLDGADSACASAGGVVRANGGVVRDCRAVGADVLLTVEVDVTLGPVTRHATARARAGPVAEQSP